MVPCPGAATERDSVVSAWPTVTKAKKAMRTDTCPVGPHQEEAAVVEAKHSAIPAMRGQGPSHPGVPGT